MEAARFPWPALGVLLLRDGLVTRDELEDVLRLQGDDRDQRLSGQRLGEVLVERGVVTSAQVARLVAEQHELPYVDLDESDALAPVTTRLPEEIARRCSALPVRVFPDDSLLVVVADPTRAGCFDEVRRATGVQIRFAIAPSDAVEAAIDAAFSRVAVDPEMQEEEVAVAEPESLQRLPWDAVGSRPVLGSLLMRDGLVTEDELDAALAQQRLSSTRRLGEILVARGVLTEEHVSRALAEQHELPFVDLDDLEIDAAAARLLPVGQARRQSALPVAYLPDGSLLVAVANPTTVYDDDLRAALGVPLQFAVAVPDQIDAAITSFAEPDAHAPVREVEATEAMASLHGSAPILDETGEETTAAPHEDAEPDLRLEDIEPVAPKHEEFAEVFHLDHAFDLDQAFDLGEAEAAEAEADAVISEADAAIAPDASTMEDVDGEFTHAERFDVDVLESLDESPAVDEAQTDDADATELAAAGIDDAIERALASGATALHVSPQPTGLVVRARVDGVLRELETIPSSVQASVTSRLKPTTQLQLGEETIESRVEVLSTKEGEKLTLYFLRPDSAPSSLADLGMAPDSEEMLRNAIGSPLGAIFFCGPAKSGTTTTLHAALRALNTPERQLATIEDPVGQIIPGVDQVEIDPAAGLTFARGFHAILRSDPDVVGVDEIHSAEAARVAVEAALTDALVLATLRARTATAATRQLTDMVNARLLGSALVCVLAQRLVRRVCSDCREGYYATQDELRELGRPAEEASPRLLARGRGCSTCGGSGFRGRVGIFEILPLTEEIRALVVEGASSADIQAVAVAAGMRTLREDGIRLCLEGVTTAAEVRRVLGEQDT